MALRPGQDAAIIESLSSGLSIAETARRAGVSERTISRRIAAPGFRRELDDVRDRAVSQAVGLLGQAARRAVTTLVQLTEDESPSIRLGAAKAILDSLGRLRENVAFATRLGDLETRLAEISDAA